MHLFHPIFCSLIHSFLLTTQSNFNARVYGTHSHQKSLYVKQSRINFRLFELFCTMQELFGPAGMRIYDFLSLKILACLLHRGKISQYLWKSVRFMDFFWVELSFQHFSFHFHSSTDKSVPRQKERLRCILIEFSLTNAFSLHPKKISDSEKMN